MHDFPETLTSAIQIPDKLVIATRESALALWQAHYVKDKLEAVFPALKVELLGMTTKGDQILDSPLSKIGGKGLFVKELETALLDGRADIAVHSMKDVPMDFPQGLILPTICERENPCDAFVSNHFDSFENLPQGAIVGTSSLRRQCQLRYKRPDIVVKDLRGNVNTRLRKLDEGEFDAIILAAAGLIRLGMQDRIAQILPTELSLPAGGQGAVGIECRGSDTVTQALLSVLHDQPTALCVRAERAMNKHLEGGCQVPIACFALLDDDMLDLKGLVGSPDGKTMLFAQAQGPSSCPEALGVEVALQLLKQGAGPLLDAIRE